jgi:hypothetical protein
MTERRITLKNPAGWFAAGREVARAMSILSDGAFKLYMHVCLTADRSTGRLNVDHGTLAIGLMKSRRSIVKYVEELRECGIFTTRAAANHGSPSLNANGKVGKSSPDTFWSEQWQAPQVLVRFTPINGPGPKRMATGADNRGLIERSPLATSDSDFRPQGSFFRQNWPLLTNGDNLDKWIDRRNGGYLRRA